MINIFFYCTGLSQLTIPTSVSHLGQNAFQGCTALSSITVPGSLTVISSGLFANCSNLSTINLEEGITTIEDGAFANCGISSITFPESVTVMNGYSIFDGCSSLTSITVCAGTPPDISSETLSSTILENATLYVYNNCKAVYETCDIWKTFNKIQGISIPARTLVHGQNFSNSFEKDVDELSYSRTYKKSAWLPWYVPFDLLLTSDVLNNFSFAKFCGTYTEEDKNGNDVFYISVSRMIEGETVKANTPYCIKAKTESTEPQVITITNATLKTNTEAGFDMYSPEKKISFMGIYSDKTATDEDCDWYFINSTGYVHVTKGQTLHGFNFYMTITDRVDNPYSSTPNPNNIKLMVLGDDDVTIIDEISVNERQTYDKAAFDLHGRKIRKDTLEKGIYIINGKKVFVK